MSFRQNILVLVVFSLAFILSLPSLSMGAVEYPSAIGPQSMVVVTGEFSDEKPKYHPSVDQIGPKDSYKQSKVGDVKILADAILAADGEVDYSAYRHIIVSLITPRKFGWLYYPHIYTYPYISLERPAGGDGRWRNRGGGHPSAGYIHN